MNYTISVPRSPRLVGSRTVYYIDDKGEEIQLALRMFVCENQPKPYLAVDFFKQDGGIPVPVDVKVSTNNELGSQPVDIPCFGPRLLGICLDAGFKVSYQGSVLVSGDPGIQAVDEIIDHEFQRSN